MAHANIVDHIGSKVTVFTKDGNAAENRQLHTVDEFGIVISNQYGKQTFIPWIQVKYVDYVEEPSVPLWNDPYKGAADAVESVPSLASYTTDDLFNELGKRTNFHVLLVEPGEEYRIDIGKQGHNLQGPATVLFKQD